MYDTKVLLYAHFLKYVSLFVFELDKQTVSEGSYINLWYFLHNLSLPSSCNILPYKQYQGSRSKLDLVIMNMNYNNQEPALPRRSRRLASIIPASHWISMGYSELDARLMEKLQNDMKRYCDGGSDDTAIRLMGQHVLLGENILPHNDMMLPHWKKFANGLDRRTNIDIINIFGISLPRPILDIMLPTFQSMKTLNDISLVDVGLGNDGLLCLISFLKDNMHLQILGIGGEIIDLSVAASFSEAMLNHPTLNQLMLGKCGLNNVASLKKILEGSKRLNSFSLGFETLGLDCVTVLADFIRSNHPLELLELSHNKIADSDTVLLASAFNNNTNLKRLDLRYNDITEEGDNNLLKVMFDLTSMDSIINSNHLCKIYTYDYEKLSMVAQRPPLEIEVIKINKNKEYSIGQKIRKKVVLALCGTDGGLFDLSHFNVSLLLMPRVLELIQEHTMTREERCSNVPLQLEKDALSRLFHTLRGWELPLLFENLNRPSTNTSRKRKRRKTRRH